MGFIAKTIINGGHLEFLKKINSIGNKNDLWKNKIKNYKIKKENEMENKILFGMNAEGKEFKALIEKREVLVASGNSTKELDEIMTNQYSHLLFNPKKAIRMKYLLDVDSSLLSAEEKQELIDLVNEEVEFKKNSMFISLPVEIQKMIGDTKKLKVAKILKTTKQGRFKQTQELTWVPTIMKSFAITPDMVSEHDIPSSVCRGKIELGETAETKKKILKFDFVSIVYDEYTNRMNSHLWSIIYDLVEKNTIDMFPEVSDDDIL